MDPTKHRPRTSANVRGRPRALFRLTFLSQMYFLRNYTKTSQQGNNMVVLTNIRQRPRKITTTREQKPRQLDYLIYIYSKKI